MPQFTGEGHGLPEGGFGFFDSRRIAMGCDFAQNSQSPRLLRPSLVVTGELEGLAAEPDRGVQVRDPQEERELDLHGRQRDARDANLRRHGQPRPRR